MAFCPDDIRLEVDDAPNDLAQICNDLWALGEEKWITLSPVDALLQLDGGSIAPLTANVPVGSGSLCEQDPPAPPVPPRISSRSLSAELHIPESPASTLMTCHSPCGLIDRKCSSPSIVRKFGAMLQENEGKVLVDGAITPCYAPPSAKCNVGCCHSRWSCDSSNFVNGKSPAHGSVLKSFSEVNILSAGRDSKNLQVPPMVKDLQVDLLLSSLEILPSGHGGHGSRRNIMLEQKTAEFNRTLFQAEMGRSVEEKEEEEGEERASLHVETSSSAESLNPAGGFFQPQRADVSESTLKEVEPKHSRSGPEGQEAKLTFQSEPQLRLSDAEVKLTSQAMCSPSRKSEGRAASEDVFPGAASPANTQPGLSFDGSETKNPGQAKPGPAKAGTSLQQPPTESKQRPATQPRLASNQPDPSRAGPRVMNDHPWKPLTLAAYPRPEGSRSNYGALERILKNYESAGQARRELKEQAEVLSSSSISQTVVTELDLLDADPLTPPPTLRHTQTHAKFKSHSSVCVKEIHRTVQVGCQLTESVQKTNGIQFSSLTSAKPIFGHPNLQLKRV